MLLTIRKRLNQSADPKKALSQKKYFKNCQNDIFLGLSAPLQKKLAKEFSTLSLTDVRQLMKSKIRDERVLAHAILCVKFKKGDQNLQQKIFEFYLKNRKWIHEWDGVDDSAPYIVGAYLLDKDKALLYQLAKAERIWDRRIAIVSTWWFIRHQRIHDTIKISQMLLNDQEDLIHKATGWMLREVGKRNRLALVNFLNKHHKIMPRTMLRYSIEHFSPKERQKYLKK